MCSFDIEKSENFNILRFKVGELDSNCYTIEPLAEEFSGDAILIDAGGDFEKVNSALASRGRQVKAVLLTHGHFDHVMAASEFKNRGAKIYLSENDQKLIDGNGNLAKYFGLHLDKFSADNGLIGGLLHICGLNIEVIETPGHTSGGRCFIIGDALFSGDTLMKDSFGRCDFVSGNENEIIKSIKSLFALDKDYVVYPGHGEKTSLFYEREYNSIRALFAQKI